MSDNNKPKRLRWKKQEKARGLAAIGAGPRGSEYHDGEDHYATVHALRKNYEVVGWYWAAYGQVPYRNTCNEPCATEAEAKAAAAAYVKANLP
jgi:hypothetical protein